MPERKERFTAKVRVAQELYCYGTYETLTVGTECESVEEAIEVVRRRLENCGYKVIWINIERQFVL